jgi:hypothetical protein
VKHRVGCAAFVVIGLAWLGFVLFDLFAATLGDCGDDKACNFYRSYVSGFIMWRGLAVALLLILAYLAFRFFHKDDDVQ